MPIVNYDWDEVEDNIDEEYDDNGNTIVEYTSEPTLYGSVISQNRGGTTSTYHFDGLGNTTELTDDSGNVTDTRRYSAFGEVSQSNGSTVFPFQYMGRFGYYLDSESGLLSIRRRPYSASLMRWLSIDVIELLAALRPYVYCKNRAVLLRDPSGEECGPADDPPKPKDPIPPKEKDRMKLCKDCCGVTRTSPVPGRAHVTCSGGMMVVVFPVVGGDAGVYLDLDQCLLLHCNLDHEEYHIEQMLAMCTNNPCNGEPDGGYVGFTKPNCTRMAECFALQHHIECLYAERIRLQNGTPECKELLENEITLRKHTMEELGCLTQSIPIPKESK